MIKDKPKLDFRYLLTKGAFKYYVIKEVGGWVGQTMMFDDKVGELGWLNAAVIKNLTQCPSSVSKLT